MESYDLVIDTQGLLKSALIARMARGRRCGYAASSAREPIAARFYDAASRCQTISTPSNAIVGSRRSPPITHRAGPRLWNRRAAGADS
jgi:ADP-heptose:LPS heptosyltransferase